MVEVRDGQCYFFVINLAGGMVTILVKVVVGLAKSGVGLGV